MTDTERQTRTYFESFRLSEVEVEGRSGRLSEMHGRAVPYDTWATIFSASKPPYRERHAAASFKRSTDGAARGLPLLLFHDARNFPVGVSTAWEHTRDAVLGTWRFNNTPEAQRAASAAADGELTGLSVGFLPSRAPQVDLAGEYDPDAGPDHMDKVTHLESRLVEVSLTPTPAFVDAEVIHVRSAFDPRPIRGRPDYDAWSRKLDALRR